MAIYRGINISIKSKVKRPSSVVRQPTGYMLDVLANYLSAEISCRKELMWLELVGTYLPHKLYFPKFVETGGEKEGGNRKSERKNGLVSRSKDAQRSKRKHKLRGWEDFQDSVSS